MNSMSNGTRTPQNNVPAGRAADRLPRVDPYGFERSVDFDYDSYEELMSEYLVVLTRRSIKWSKLLQRGNKLQKNVKVKRYVRKGIPNEYRALTWMAASGAQEQLEKNPGYYHALLTGEHDARLVEVIRTGYPEPPFAPTLTSIFASNMSSFLMIVSLLATSGLVLMHYMAKNLHRTFPDNVQFQKTSNPCLQKALFNVLLAYGHHDKAVGYCQGMNFIAGYLIIITKDEEKSFWLLDALLGRILPDYYTPAMLGLKTDQEVLGELVRVKVPAVWQAMTEHNVMWTLVVSRWFICLFIDVLPVETVLRIWDSLFYEGSKIIFRVALTLIKHNEAFILQARSFPDICDHFKQITKGALVEDCHGFMQKIFAEPGSLSMGTIQKLRESCRARIIAEEAR